LPALLKIARSGYVDSRFYYDGHIPRPLCDAFFETWTLQSCAGGADQVLVAHESKTAARTRKRTVNPVGYVTLHADRKSRSGRIGLIAVAPAARGKGIGTRLIDGTLAWAAQQKLKSLTVVTQGRNIAAQRLYQRRGFIMQSLQLYYHKWYD
jgi:dTDP-4-amino-4,6-dideoxy-D-galactose acyltransferase